MAAVERAASGRDQSECCGDHAGSEGWPAVKDMRGSATGSAAGSEKGLRRAQSGSVWEACYWYSGVVNMIVLDRLSCDSGSAHREDGCKDPVFLLADLLAHHKHLLGDLHWHLRTRGGENEEARSETADALRNGRGRGMSEAAARAERWGDRTVAVCVCVSPSRRRDCHSTDTCSPSLLKHLRNVEQQNDSLAAG